MSCSANRSKIRGGGVWLHRMRELDCWKQDLCGTSATIGEPLAVEGLWQCLQGLTQANAGDSRGVLGIKGRAKPLSQDHKPQLESKFVPRTMISSLLSRTFRADALLLLRTDEKNRITAAGGFVDFGRVNGNLALSRAIGDFEFKKSNDLPLRTKLSPPS